MPPAQVLSICRKAHLFGDVDRASVQSGGYPVPACAVWRLVGGVSRSVMTSNSPNLSERMRSAGADIVLVPTANMLPYIGVATRVVPARAEENEIYVAYANRVGREGAFEYCGLSCVVGPDGNDAARASPNEEMIIADISKNNYANTKLAIPHQRPPQ